MSSTDSLAVVQLVAKEKQTVVSTQVILRLAFPPNEPGLASVSRALGLLLLPLLLPKVFFHAYSQRQSLSESSLHCDRARSLLRRQTGRCCPRGSWRQSLCHRD
jgi:hypothetical protein